MISSLSIDNVFELKTTHMLCPVHLVAARGKVCRLQLHLVLLMNTRVPVPADDGWIFSGA